MDLKTCLYVGFALYTIFVIYVGFIGSKKIKGLSDFAVASESMGPISLGLAFAASFFSAATFLGYVGYAYAWGASALWIFLAIFGGSTLGFIVIAKGVRDSNTKIKALSLPDWLGEMYKSDFLRALVSIIVMIQMFYVAGQLSAGGTLLSGLLDIDYSTAVIAVTVVTIVYVTLGGLFADVYTSIGQTCLMMFAGVIVFLSGFFFFKGGITEVSTIIAARDPLLTAVINPKSLHMYSYATVFGVILIEFAFSGQPQLLTKILALKDPKDMKKMIWTWIVASFCCMLVIFGGLYMLALNPDLQQPDYAVVEYVRAYFHPIISTLLAVSIVAALMSTACGLLLVMTTCIANDLYEFKPDEKWLIIPSVRYDYSDKFGSEITSRLATTYNAAKDIRVKAVIGQGYKTPTVNELYHFWEMYAANPGGSGQFFEGNPDLQPEKSLSYELAVEKDWGDKTTAHLGIFRNDVKDLISSYWTGRFTDDDPNSYPGLGRDQVMTYRNVPKATLQGVEFYGSHELGKNIFMNFGYTYLEAKDKTGGTRLTDRAKHQLTFGVSYQPQNIYAWDCSFDIVSNLNYYYHNADKSTMGNSVYSTKNFTIANIMASKHLTKDAKIYLGIDNISNHRNFGAYADGNLGRLYRVGMEYKF